MPNAITEVDIDEYVRTYRQPGAMRAGFSYYRELQKDIEDNKENILRLKLMPVLAIGGGVKLLLMREEGNTNRRLSPPSSR